MAYHTVPDRNSFERQLAYLSSNYSVINLNTLKNHIFDSVKLPPNPLLITFDDGDISVLENGLPILKKYKLPSTLFIVTDLVNSNKSFWWNRASIYYNNQGLSEIEVREKVKNLKMVSDSERLKELSRMPEAFTRQLKLEELKHLEGNGMAICNHSHTHPLLNRCTTEKIQNELEVSKKKLFEWNLNNADIFAYPNGNFNNKVEKILIEKKFSMAFLFDHKVNKTEIHPLRISRLKVDSDTEMMEFKVKVSGLHPLLYDKFLKKIN